jgi:LPS-assembly lipoprotein
MSSGEGETQGRAMFASRQGTIRVALACAAACMLVAGCGDSGFRPMYASSAITGGTDVNQKLAELEIAPIPGRVGQRIRNELIYQATGGAGSVAQPVYRLEIIMRESITPTLVQIDGNSSGSVYNLSTSFRLVRLADKSVALTGESSSRAAFQRFDSVFANVRARQDAEDRAAKTIGEELKGRVAAYLSGAA